MDGLCCERACDDVCEACGDGGRCVTAPDDDACGTIVCPESTPCRSYPPTLVFGRCRAPGACKTRADCPTTDAPARTPCEGTAPTQRLCDGAGRCAQPTIPCGDEPACPVQPGHCCFDIRSRTLACQTDPELCPPSTSTIPYGCDGEGSCPLGTVCCMNSALGLWSADCRAPADCFGYELLCDPGADPSVCGSPEHCIPYQGAWMTTGYFHCG